MTYSTAGRSAVSGNLFLRGVPTAVRVSALSVAVSALAGGFAAPVLGQPVPARVAEAIGSPRPFDIPTAPLAEALPRFAEQAGLRLRYAPADLDGLRSAPVSGTMPPVDALRALLGGTGLVHRFAEDGTVVVEPTGAAARTGVETIVVTGLRGERPTSTKLPLSVRETPQSISIITRESLDARQVVTLGQALELSAGVTQFSGNGPFAGQPSFGFNQTTIRGIHIDDIYDFREDGFVNGSYFSIPDLAIYDRLEVVKGPSSMLFGRGSPGGLVNRVRKKPLAEARTEVGIDVGSYANYRVDLDTTGPLSDAVQARLVAAFEDSESFVRGPQTQRSVLAPSVGVDISPRTRLLIQGFYQGEDIVANTGFPLRGDGTGSGFEAPDIDRRQYNGVVTQNPYTWRIRSAGVELDQEIGDRWLAALRFNNTGIDTPIRTDGYVYSYGGLPPDGSASMLANDFQLEREVWSGELQVTGKLPLFGREAVVGFGADWNDNQYSRRGAYAYADQYANLYDGFFPTPDPDTMTPGFATDTTPVSRGVYAQARLPMTDRLAILLGARYDDVKFSLVPYHQILDGEPERVHGAVSDTTGRVGLTYDLTAQATVYGLYSQSFSPELFSTDRSGNLLEPETGESFEVGVKTEWLDGKFGLSAAVYRIDREHIATSVPDDPTDDVPPYSIASGLQRSDGFEVEINGRPLPGLNLSFAYNDVDSEYEDPNDPLFGSKPGGTPDWQLGVFSTYEIQTGVLEGLGFGATVFAIDDRGIGYLPATIPGYHRTDLHAFYHGFENTEISLVIRNVTDERYIEGADRPGAIAQFGSPTAAMLTVRRSF
jgi:outer membrane receptor for ferric coprogen and ferric-rhodotorulic acid